MGKTVVEKNFCIKCQGNCCSKESGDRFITKEEISEIKAMGYTDFHHKKRSAGFSVLNTKNDFCIFYNKQKNGCMIYKIRPADCKIFPYDIILRDGKYFWILWEWSESKCILRKSMDHDKTLKILEKEVILKFLNYLEPYAKYTDVILSSGKKRYSILREIQIPDNK